MNTSIKRPHNEALSVGRAKSTPLKRSVSFQEFLVKIVLYILFVIASTVSHAKDISISDSGISFVVPDEFQFLSQELIDVKWQNRNAPKWVIGNLSGSTTIAFDLKPNDISSASLPDLMSYFKTTFDRIIPGIQWIKLEIIRLSGKRWVYLEMTSNAIDTDIHNIMLITSHGKEMLIFNFNSTKEDFSKYEPELRKSITTIRLPK